MAERTDIHVDVGAYLLGRLDGHERARFEEHMAACESCRAAAGELEGTAALLAGAAAPATPPADLESRTLLAVREAAGAGQGRRPTLNGRALRPVAAVRTLRRRSAAWRRAGLVAGAAAALALAVLVGSRLGDDGLPGSLELEATLTSPQGQTASATVRETGIGRVIEFRTDELPILPTGEYYELWFVGPGDRPGDPNRISAGTFHPDPEGRSRVRFAAAVDPAKYPRLAVTAEPGDGDPSPSGQDVLRSAR